MFKAGATVKWNGDQISHAVQEKTGRTIQMATLDLKQRSSDQAPVDTGDLRGNCSAVFDRAVLAPASEGETIEKPAEGLTGRVGYTLPYARVQHEEMDYKHPKGGKAKYLEDPANAMAKTYKTAIAKAVGEGIKG